MKIFFIIVAIFFDSVMTWHMVNIHGAKAAGAGKEEIIHDYILNFLGTAIGWTSLYYLIFCRLGNKLELTDLILIWVAFAGITGYLPHLIINKGLKP